MITLTGSKLTLDHSFGEIPLSMSTNDVVCVGAGCDVREAYGGRRVPDQAGRRRRQLLRHREWHVRCARHRR